MVLFVEQTSLHKGFSNNYYNYAKYITYRPPSPHPPTVGQFDGIFKDPDNFLNKDHNALWTKFQIEIL